MCQKCDTITAETENAPARLIFFFYRTETTGFLRLFSSHIWHTQKHFIPNLTQCQVFSENFIGRHKKSSRFR
nr:MAG TPA: hypothetical protein [Caudoviricetes sp.]